MSVATATAGNVDWTRFDEGRSLMVEGPRWYGVAVGDGNFGVSRMWADFYVRTDDPQSVAEFVARKDIEPAHHDEIELDGDAETGLVALLPSEEEDRPAEYVVEVFPEDDEAWLSRRKSEVPFYDDLDALVGDWRAY